MRVICVLRNANLTGGAKKSKCTKEDAHCTSTHTLTNLTGFQAPPVHFSFYYKYYYSPAFRVLMSTADYC